MITLTQPIIDAIEQTGSYQAANQEEAEQILQAAKKHWPLRSFKTNWRMGSHYVICYTPAGKIEI